MVLERRQWTAWTTLNGARCPPCPLPYDGDGVSLTKACTGYRSRSLNEP